MNNNVVSVIIASYNYAQFIGETLDSLIAQTHENWECIIVDDGSTDNTAEVVADYSKRDARIKYIYQRNAGQAAARNSALKIVKGDYIQFLDADDLLEPQKLERQVEYLKSHSDTDIVYGETRYFRTEFPHERRHSLWDDIPWMPKLSGRGSLLIKSLIHNNIVTVSSPLLRKSVVDLVGDFDPRLNPLEDWDYWMRCAIANVLFQHLQAARTMDLIRVHKFSSSQNLNHVYFKRVLLRRKFNRILPAAQLRQENFKILYTEERHLVGTEGKDAMRQLKNNQIWQGLSRIGKTVKLSPLMSCRIIMDRVLARTKGNKTLAEKH